MSYVAVSRGLIHSVRHKIKEMSRREVERECPLLDSDFKADITDLFMYISWRSYKETMLPLMPKSWLKHTKYPYVRVVEDSCADAVAAFAEVNDAQDVARKRLLLPEEVTPRPNCGNWFDDNCITLSELESIAHTYPNGQLFLDSIHQANTAREIQLKWDKVSRQVIDYLEACKSINEAVKLMPNIKLYLDKDVIERLERKSERSGDKPAVIPIPTQDVTAAAMAAKLTGLL